MGEENFEYQNIEREIKEMGKNAKVASDKLASLPGSHRDDALLKIADLLEENQDRILRANNKDMNAGRKDGLSEALMDRLLLNEERIKGMADGLREVAELPDPVGGIENMKRRPNGLQVGKMRVPLGVVGIIYESRPNVTVDAGGLCLKAGNAIILRGGSEAINSNITITEIIQDGLEASGLSRAAVQLIETTDRAAVKELLTLNEYLDLLIPRGGAGLINMVVEEATVPVIQTGVGNCHIFIENSADLDDAEEIIINAKTQRPAVCNALETLLVEKDTARSFIPRIVRSLVNMGVQIRGCEQTLEILKDSDLTNAVRPEMIIPAENEDWGTEFLDLILAVKVVSDTDEAAAHIGKYGSGHSEAILTNDYQKALSFINRIDAAAVYVNASTRFTDGNQFGLGAEIGISTQKLHARGPMGINELTTTKFVIFGQGQIRN